MVKDWNNHGDNLIKLTLQPKNSRKRDKHYLFIDRNSRKVFANDPTEKMK